MKVWHNGDNIWFELSHEEDYFQAFQGIFDRRLVVSVTSIRTAMQLVLNLVDCINSWWGEDDDKRSEVLSELNKTASPPCYILHP